MIDLLIPTLPGLTSGARAAQPSLAPSGSGQPQEFAATLAAAASGVVETVRAGEAAALAGIEGRASVQQVVERVMQAEQSLHMAIAIRDKVVAAYLELGRMQI
jgi:flagellar hook-basal body complex protein FliE